ncbi:transposase family protein [Streptomyces sp. WM6378]|uniref:transposase family protein n=1 Tax=Streptomyces sp. WM6378 TaxID=1415557 RepID=UPI000ACDBD46|nr:transposase family protein [Streptomyces sp. WM6378]
MTKKWARAALSHPAFCGLGHVHLGHLIVELAAPWTARQESGLRERRRGDRCRAAGAGPKYELALTDRVLVTLAYLRTGLTHQALAELYRAGRSTVTEAISEIRPLLAARGFAVPDRPNVRLRTLADVFAYADAEGVTLCFDGAETQVRRPKAGRPGRRAFVSGKKKQNTIKTTVIGDEQSRTLWTGAVRPGRMHDQTAARTEGVAEQFGLTRRRRPKPTRATGACTTSSPTRSASRPGNPRPTRRWASSMPGASTAAASPRPESASSTRSPSTGSGAHSSATRPDARHTPKPIWPSPAWSPTAPPAEQPNVSPVPNWRSPGRPPADHLPAEPPDKHTPSSIAYEVVRRPARQASWCMIEGVDSTSGSSTASSNAPGSAAASSLFGF